MRDALRPSLFGILLIGAAVVAALAAAGVVGYVVFWLVRNKLSPVQRVRARVVRRRKKDWDVSLVGDTPESAAARLGMLGRNRHAAYKAYSKAMAGSDVREVQLAGALTAL